MGWARGRAREESSCGQLGGISDQIGHLGRCLEFNSCFLIAGNERIYEPLRDVHYRNSLNVLLI